MYVHQPKLASANEALAKISLDLLTDSYAVDIVSAEGEVVQTREIIDYNIRFSPYYANIPTLPSRKFPKKGACAEFLWYMSADYRVDAITKYLKNWQRFANEQGFVNSNYGHYWRKYLWQVIDALRYDKYSRRAIMNVFHVGNAPFGKDTPCTLTWQFFIRDNKLDMVVNMRSNDVWYGFSIDQFCNSLFHQLVLHELQTKYIDLELGTYSHHAASMHAYTNTVPMQKLKDAWTEFNDVDMLAEERISIPAGVTFSNFWTDESQTALQSVFDPEMLAYFKERHNQIAYEHYE